MYPAVVKSEVILACRACLAINVRLYNINDNYLNVMFGQLTGNQVFEADGLPQYLCVFCRAMLLKFMEFRNKTQTSQSLLVTVLLEQQFVSMECLKNINRQEYNLTIPWHEEKLNSLEIIPNENDSDEVKFEIINSVESKQTYISTDAPNVSSIVKNAVNSIVPIKKPKRNDNDKLEITESNVKNEFNEYEKNVDLNSDHSFDDMIDSDDEEPLSKIKLTPEKKRRKVKANKVHIEVKSKYKKTNKSKKAVDKGKYTNSHCSRTLEECEVKKKSIKKSNFETDEYWFWFEDDEKKNKFEAEFNFEVIVLTKDQQIEAMQAKKNEKNYMDSPYKCDLCFRGYLNVVGYKNHMASHELKQDGHVVCDICGQRFRHKRQLVSHTVGHKVRLRCKECGYTNPKKTRAMEHYRAHQGHKFECEHCGNTFRLKSNYYTHLRFLHPSELLSCDVCGEGFCGEKGLQMHKRIHLLDEVVKKKSSSEHRCASCDVQFRNYDAWDAHTQADIEDSCSTLTKPCLDCGLNFADEDSLQQHAETHKQLYQCEACDMTFPSEASRKTHFERKHLSVKRKDMRHASKYQYYYKKYKDKNTGREGPGVRQPRGTSGQEGKSMCEFCGKKFRSPAALLAHHRTHTGDRPFECSVCQKRFASRNYLQMHFYTHTGERPFQCKLCPKAFSKKSVLNVHQRVHTGAKPYTCPACGKSFTQSNSLKLHVTTVHLKQPAPYKSKKRLQRQQERLQGKTEA